MAELNYIGGVWRAASSGATFTCANPARPDDIAGTYPASDSADARAAFAAAAAALPAWRATPLIERGRLLQNAARLLEARFETISGQLVREVGKPLREARAEVQRTIDLFDYYGALAWHPAGALLASARPHTHIRTQRVPLGVVALITPWNFPLAIPAWKLAPALLMGNTVVLKPSELGPAGAVVLGIALEQAGLPPGVLNLVLGAGAPFGAVLPETDALRALSFTGSQAVGRALHASLAGRLVRVQLEMGSKNPLLVWEDADVPSAAQLAISGAFGFAGQTCTATSRIIVHQAVYEPFKAELLAALAALEPGDPTDPATQFGPLISAAAQQNVAAWVQRGLESGGTLLAGGTTPNQPGFFYAPTVLEGVPLDAPLAQTEVFGPLVTLHAADSLAALLAAANATDYGLAASIATRSLDVAEAFFAGVEAGLLHVNQPTAGVEFQAPFGGTKGSSFGPSEQAHSALDFFSAWKTQVLCV